MLITRTDYFETPEGLKILESLESMSSSDEYVTQDSYTPQSEQLITFTEKHQQYIRKHPNINAQHYVSNLKIICRRR
jgi:hypothetical protein